MALSYQQPLPRLHKPLRFDAIEIHTRRHGTSGRGFAIPQRVMETVILLGINQHAHAAAEKVEDFQLDFRGHGQVVLDERFRVK